MVLSDTISEKNLEAITKDTHGTAIVNAVRVESLNKGLSVFEMIGFIAIACGVLLYLIGGPI